MNVTLACQNGIEALLHLLFPLTCSACHSNEVSSKHPICYSCSSTLPYTAFEEKRNNTVEKLFWGRVPLSFASSTFHFTEGSRIQNILHEIKYKDAQALGVYMGTLMGMSLKKTLHAHQINLCIPMPLHRKKIITRGYNQASLLCKGIQEATGIGFDENAVLRRHHTETQTHKSRVERWTNVSGIFEVGYRDSIQGRNLLIIDDVITTGASAESCAHTLLDAGANQVAVASLAYTN